ncbi:hypothetical protein FBZ91_102148 [Nitrospirillum viridazoti]|nr:hypothetical protein FBZ91_102148 [Nitrospirillum amazonense]
MTKATTGPSRRRGRGGLVVALTVVNSAGMVGKRPGGGGSLIHPWPPGKTPYSMGMAPGIMLAFRCSMTHQEPTTRMATISSVNRNAAMFQDRADELFMCRK